MHQLASDFPEEPLTVKVVTNYFAGRAEVKGFKIADDALAGRAEEALVELRWALETGTPAVLIVGSFASGVRSLARFVGAPRGLRDADLAREAGVPPWKVNQLRAQARGWDRSASRRDQRGRPRRCRGQGRGRGPCLRPGAHGAHGGRRPALDRLGPLRRDRVLDPRSSTLVSG